MARLEGDILHFHGWRYQWQGDGAGIIQGDDDQEYLFSGQDLIGDKADRKWRRGRLADGRKIEVDPQFLRYPARVSFDAVNDLLGNRAVKVRHAEEWPGESSHRARSESESRRHREDYRKR